MQTNTADTLTLSLKGFSSLLESCAAALLNQPGTPEALRVVQVGRLLASDCFEQVVCAPLQQHYYDRFFVPTSSCYVALYEGVIRGAVLKQGRIQYGSGFDPHHLLLCYNAVDFKYKELKGFDLSVKSLKPDSLGSELAFMAYLAVRASASDPETAHAAVCLLQRFVKEHALQWFNRAAECMAATGDDFYARVVALAAETTALWADEFSLKSA